MPKLAPPKKNATMDPKDSVLGAPSNIKSKSTKRPKPKDGVPNAPSQR